MLFELPDFVDRLDNLTFMCFTTTLKYTPVAAVKPVTTMFYSYIFSPINATESKSYTHCCNIAVANCQSKKYMQMYQKSTSFRFRFR